MATSAPAVYDLAALMTDDPFCAQEGVQTLQSMEHYQRLFGLLSDLSLHVETRGLPYTVVSDLLLRNIPLKPGVSPDVLLLPGQWDLETVGDVKSLDLTVDPSPTLILEVVSENTYEADADIKPEIYRLVGVQEYWLYDPRGFAGGPPLCAWQLQDGAYVPIAGIAATVAGETVTLYPSAVLQTDWGLTTDASLRLRLPTQDAWYQTTPAALQQVQARAEQAELQRIRAEQAELRVAQERIRAEQAEAEIARLRALLNGPPDSKEV